MIRPMNINRSLCLCAALPLAALATLSLSSCSPTAPSQTKLAPGQFEWQPQNSPSGPVLMAVSIDDQMAYVYRKAMLSLPSDPTYGYLMNSPVSWPH